MRPMSTLSLVRRTGHVHIEATEATRAEIRYPGTAPMEGSIGRCGQIAVEGQPDGDQGQALGLLRTGAVGVLKPPLSDG